MTTPPSPPPPLPEFADLVERSEWLRGRAGLESEVLRWHRSLEAERQRIVGEAEELATPRLRAHPVRRPVPRRDPLPVVQPRRLIGRFASAGRLPSSAEAAAGGPSISCRPGARPT